MSWLWWKSPPDELSSSSSSSETQHTNSAPTSISTSISTSKSIPTNDPPAPIPPTPLLTSTSTSNTTTTITDPSKATSSPNPYQPLDPLTESSLPTTLPCTPLFDSAFFCSSLGGHLTSIYRTGAIADCRDNWSRFWFCMRTRAIWDEDEKREVIREYNRGNWRESYYGGRNWVLRDGEYRDRTGGMDPTTASSASSMMATARAGSSGSSSSSSSKYAYVTDDDDDDHVSSPEGSQKKGWRSLFRARSRDTGAAGNGGAVNTDAGGDDLAAGGGSGRYRSSEDIWELRTEPVARAFDLHPLRDLEEVLIDEQGRKYRVKDLGERREGG